MRLAVRAGLSLLNSPCTCRRQNVHSFRDVSFSLLIGSKKRAFAPLSTQAMVIDPEPPVPTHLLRPYQEECIKACLDALNSGITRIGVSSPTGSGKTTIFCSLLSQIQSPPSNPEATKALILVCTVELARQTANAAKAMYPDLVVEIEQGQNKASGAADITIATFQTLSRGSRLDKFDPSQFKVVIVDEAHHSTASSYTHILSRFHSSIKSGKETTTPADSDVVRSVPIVGVSATLNRHDGHALGQVFEHIVFHKDLLEMIRDKWLAPIVYTKVKVDMDLGSVSVREDTGDFVASSLARVIDTDAMHEVIVRTWLDRMSEEDRKSTLIFGVNVAHVKNLTASFRDANVDARFIVGKTPASERRDLLDGFRRGAYPVLINCDVLTEGADIPNIDCLVFARPTKSKNLFLQMLGRGTRLSPKTGKADCRVIDFVDSLSHIEGVIDGPSLLGIIPDAVIEAGSQSRDKKDSGLEGVENNGSELDDAPDQSTPKSVTFQDFDDPFSLVSDAVGSPSLARMSPLAWVKCSVDTYILECLGQGFLKIKPKSSDVPKKQIWEAWYTPSKESLRGGSASSDNKLPYLRKRKVADAETLKDALRCCDSYVNKYVVKSNYLHRGLYRTAAWRRHPATEAQLVKLRSLRKKPSLGSGVELTSQNITKGQAANIISRLKGGAQAYYEQHSKRAKALQRDKVREEKKRIKRDGHIIRVGPLKIPHS